MIIRPLYKILLPFCMLLSTAIALPVEYSDFSKPLVVTSQNSMITLNIPGNPTTGYTWVLQDNDNRQLIRPIKYRYSSKNKRIVGGGGLFQFTFRVMPEAFIVPTLLKPLHFIYLRSWEKGEAKTLDVQLITAY